MQRLPRPCLDCGVLTTNPSRCDRHQADADQRRAYRQANNLQRKEKKTRLYSKDYQLRAKRIRETATVCYLCLEHKRADDPLQVDHLYPELFDSSPLLPAHRSCNNRKGNTPLDELNPNEWPGLDNALRMFPPAYWLRRRRS